MNKETVLIIWLFVAASLCMQNCAGKTQSYDATILNTQKCFTETSFLEVIQKVSNLPTVWITTLQVKKKISQPNLNICLTFLPSASLSPHVLASEPDTIQLPLSFETMFLDLPITKHATYALFILEHEIFHTLIYQHKNKETGFVTNYVNKTFPARFGDEIGADMYACKQLKNNNVSFADVIVLLSDLRAKEGSSKWEYQKENKGVHPSFEMSKQACEYVYGI
jgi:hypothetical protein